MRQATVQTFAFTLIHLLRLRPFQQSQIPRIQHSISTSTDNMKTFAIDFLFSLLAVANIINAAPTPYLTDGRIICPPPPDAPFLIRFCFQFYDPPTSTNTDLPSPTLAGSTITVRSPIPMPPGGFGPACRNVLDPKTGKLVQDCASPLPPGRDGNGLPCSPNCAAYVDDGGVIEAIEGWAESVTQPPYPTLGT
jgi:hypothetical protein